MLGLSVGTLRNWEQGRRTPDGPALALLRVAARNPKAVIHAPHTQPGGGRPDGTALLALTLTNRRPLGTYSRRMVGPFTRRAAPGDDGLQGISRPLRA
jgi:hypothetical protein